VTICATIFTLEAKYPSFSLHRLLPSTGLRFHGLGCVKFPRRDLSNSSQVSNLAQTRKPTPVIVYSAECVERATTANS